MLDLYILTVIPKPSKCGRAFNWFHGSPHKKNFKQFHGNEALIEVSRIDMQMSFSFTIKRLINTHI